MKLQPVYYQQDINKKFPFKLIFIYVIINLLINKNIIIILGEVMIPMKLTSIGSLINQERKKMENIDGGIAWKVELSNDVKENMRRLQALFEKSPPNPETTVKLEGVFSPKGKIKEDISQFY